MDNKFKGVLYMNRNNQYKITEDYMEQLERAEIKIRENELRLEAKPRIIFHIVITILTIPWFCLFGINWVAYFATNYNLRREIDIERRRIEIIERKIEREDNDRESERDVFRRR